MTNSTVEGNDELHAAGNDVVGGGAGSDTLDGGDDNDALTGGDGTDDLLGGAGVDALNGEAGLDLLDGGAGADILNGGADADAADYSASPAAVLVNMGNQSQNAGGFAAGDSLADMEVLLGSAFNDALFGDAVVNRLEGQAGNDTMDGGAGADMLLGGAGSDNLQTGSGLTDQLQGGDDADAFLIYGGGLATGATFQLPTSGNHRVSGGAGADDFDVNRGFNWITDWDDGEQIDVDFLQTTGSFAPTVVASSGGFWVARLLGVNGASLLSSTFVTTDTPTTVASANALTQLADDIGEYNPPVG